MALVAVISDIPYNTILSNSVTIISIIVTVISIAQGCAVLIGGVNMIISILFIAIGVCGV